MISLLKNLMGIAIIALSLIYSQMISGLPVMGGVLHLPSVFLVTGVTLGVALLVIEVRDLKRFVLFALTFSLDRQMRAERKAEESLEELVDVYAKEGGETLHTKVAEKGLPRIWKIVATKLAINVPIDDVKEILEFQIQKVLARLDQDIATLKQLAAMAPAIGMFGSVLGLIRLLADLQDFDSLGQNMSLALITTLYGIFIGNIVLVPLIKGVEKRKIYYLKSHTNLLYWLDHVDQKKPAFYMKTRLRDLNVETL